MEKPEDLLRDLVTQVSRLAFAIETIVIRGYQQSYCEPCRACGCTLRDCTFVLPSSTCPACKMENAR